MKTPKVSTPAPKSKLNTPRSGFIKKNSESGKKVKFSILNAEISKNGTPKIEHTPFKEKKKFNNFSSKTLVSKIKSESIDENDEINFNFNEKKSLSPIKKLSPSAKQNNLSPSKKNKNNEVSSPARLISNVKLEKKVSPKIDNQHDKSPNNKNKQNKKTPEVQLGLDIELFLDKNSSVKKTNNKSPGSTPLGAKKLEKIKAAKSPTKQPLKTSNDDKIEPKKKKMKTNVQKANQMTKEKESEKVEDLVNQVTIQNAVKSLIKYIADNPKETNTMLGGNSPLLMQVNFIKVAPSDRVRITLPHNVLPEDADICLLVADKKQGSRDPDDIVDLKKEVLKKCGVKGITEILPFKRAVQEHTQYEQRRKFGNRFDLFLIESKLAKIKSTLYNGFPRRKKPIPVKLSPEKQVKLSFDTALRKVSIVSKGVGLSKSIQFGHANMPQEKLIENVDAILKVLCHEKDFPGGRNNIRSILLKTEKSISFPLFVSTKSPNLVKIHITKVAKKEDEGVEGELSTFTDRTVTVYRDGRVVTKKIKNVEGLKEAVKEAKSNKKPINEKVKIENDEEEEEEDDDEMDVNDIDLREFEEQESDEADSDEEDDDEEEEEDDNEEEEEEEDDNEEEEEEEEDDDDDDDDDQDEDDVDSDDEDNINSKKISNKKVNKSKKTRKNESSSDENELDEAEQTFLQELRQVQDEIESKKPQKKGQNQQLKNRKIQNVTEKIVPQKKQQNDRPFNQAKRNNAKQKSAPINRSNQENEGKKQLKTNSPNNKPNWKKNKENEGKKQLKTNSPNNEPNWKKNKNKQNKQKNNNNSPFGAKQQKQVPGGKKFKSKG